MMMSITGGAKPRPNKKRYTRDDDDDDSNTNVPVITATEESKACEKAWKDRQIAAFEARLRHLQHIRFYTGFERMIKSSHFNYNFHLVLMDLVYYNHMCQYPPPFVTVWFYNDDDDDHGDRPAVLMVKEYFLQILRWLVGSLEHVGVEHRRCNSIAIYVHGSGTERIMQYGVDLELVIGPRLEHGDDDDWTMDHVMKLKDFRFGHYTVIKWSLLFFGNQFHSFARQLTQMHRGRIPSVLIQLILSYVMYCSPKLWFTSHDYVPDFYTRDHAKVAACPPLLLLVSKQ
jgi:hypothetical protein